MDFKSLETILKGYIEVFRLVYPNVSLEHTESNDNGIMFVLSRTIESFNFNGNGKIDNETRKISFTVTITKSDIKIKGDKTEVKS